MTARENNRFIKALSWALAIFAWNCLSSDCRAGFSDQTAALIPQGYNSDGLNGVMWGNINNDGFIDLATPSGGYINNDGTNFSDGGPNNAIWADYNNDCFDDISAGKFFASNEQGNAMFCVTDHGDAGGNLFWPGTSHHRAFGDLDNNGFVDLYACGGEGAVNPDNIFLNFGSQYTNAWSGNGGVYSRGVTMCDFDKDGDLDIYVSNYWLAQDNLWVNDGSATFTDEAVARGINNAGHGLGADWCDLDNDGDFDLAMANLDHGGQPPTAFWRNSGAPNYTFVNGFTAPYVERYASPAAGDYDNDGDLDVYIADLDGTPKLLRNDGGFSFTDVTAGQGIPAQGGTGAGWADYDNDGDLDLATPTKILRNDLVHGAGTHWLKVKLVGDGVQINKSAIGAQCFIDLGGGTILSRQVSTSAGERNSKVHTLHYGLGTQTTPVDLDICWPGGFTTTVSNVAVDQLITVNFESPFEAWIAQFNLPSGMDGPDDDPDGDKMTNFEEWVAGTDPGDMNDVFKIVGLDYFNGSNCVWWRIGTNTVIDTTFTLWRTTNLVNLVYEEIAGDIPRDPSGTNVYYDLNPPTIPAHYRTALSTNIMLPGPTTSTTTTTSTSTIGTTTTTSPFVNLAPYEEPFEEYDAGTSIDGTNGWVGASGSTDISTNESLIAALNAYAMTLDLPLTNASHEKVLCVVSTNGIRNKFAVSNATVFTDFMWLPTFSPFRDEIATAQVPDVNPDDQYAFFVTFDGRLAVYSGVSSGGNAWHELEEHGSMSPFVTNPTPLLKTGEWVRVSIEQNYVGSRWSIRLNQMSPISDAEGWDAPVGGSRPGPWLDMANAANAGMSAFLAEGQVAYLDDLQVKLSDPVQPSTTSSSTTSSTTTSSTSTVPPSTTSTTTSLPTTSSTTTSTIATTSTTTSPFTNVMPYAEPFEDMPPYADGFSIAGTNGWVGNEDAAVISTDSALIDAIGDFVNAGNLLPIPEAPHTKVLCIAEDEIPRGRAREPKEISNRINGNTSTVFTDLLWFPRRGTEPHVTTNHQFAFYPHLNGALIIWHEYSGSNEWHRLTNAPILSTGEWVRVTVEQNFTHSRWRIRVNGQEHISDAKGWNTAAGTIQPGAWFNMVQKGGSMKRIEFEGESCIDDLVVKRTNPFPDGLLLIIR